MEAPTALDLVEGAVVHAAQLVRTVDSATQVARYAQENAPKVVKFLRREETHVPTIAYTTIGVGLLGWALLRRKMQP